MHALHPPLPAGGPGEPASFRWSDVVPEHRDWLRKRTEDAVGLAYRQACDTVRIGALLEEVRKKVGHGLYQRWVRQEMPFCVAHARKYRQVARAFAGYESAQFARFEPSALYVLARTQGVKPEVRAHAVQLAEAGEQITRAVALELVQVHKPEPDTTASRKADAAMLESHTGEIRREEQAARKGTVREETPEERAAHLAQVGGALVQLAGECAVVHVARIDDGEDLPLFSVTTYREEDRPHNAVRRTLLDALLAAGGREQEKRCPTCKETKPHSAFGALKSRPDALNRCCKVCERSRIAGVKKKRKAKRTAAAAPAPPAPG